MSNSEWEQLFSLITEVIAIRDVTATERAALVIDKARQFGSLADLDEFVSMIASGNMDDE